MTTRPPVAADLAALIAGLSYDDIPEAAVAAAKEAILDHIGLMVRGSSLPWTRPVLDVVTALESRPESTIVCHGMKAAAPDAAMVNATFCHSCELDDSGYDGGPHPGSAAVPAALGMAEALGLSGRDVVLAVVAGYELIYRIARVFTRPISRLGFHAQSMIGPFGSVAVGATMLGLDAEQTTHAISIAASHSSGTMEYDQSGGEVKRYHAGMTARSGLMAALLAQKGLTAPPTIFEGKRGLMSLFGRVENERAFDIAAGPERADWFAVQGRTVKVYPTVGTIHTCLQAVGRLVREGNLSADSIERIDLWVNPHVLGHGASITRPRDTVGAQFSLAFSVGLAVVKRGNDLDYYLDPANFKDPRILAIGDRLEVHPDDTLETRPWGESFAARARIRLRDGTELEGEELYRKGAPENPVSHDELVTKFHSLVDGVLPAPQAEQLVELTGKLEQLPSVTELIATLA